MQQGQVGRDDHWAAHNRSWKQGCHTIFDNYDIKKYLIDNLLIIHNIVWLIQKTCHPMKFLRSFGYVWMRITLIYAYGLSALIFIKKGKKRTTL